MKTSSIAVETSRSTTQSDSIVRQTNKRSSYLSYTTMNNKHIYNDILMHIHSYIIISHFIPLSFFFRPSEVGVGREVDRACSPGRKEGGKCTGAGSAGSVASSVRKVREKWREPRLKGAGGGRFLPPPPSPSLSVP